MIKYSEQTIVGEVPEGLLGFKVFAGAVDAKRVVCLATFPQGRVVFISGEPGPKFDAVSDLQLSTHDHSVVYVGTKDGKHFVVENGTVSDGYDWVGKLSFSYDGRSLAYPIMRETSQCQEYQVMVNGNLGKIFDHIGEVVWHPKELAVAYVGAVGQSERVVLGDSLLPEFERVRGLQFSPKGQIHYWGFKQGNWWLCNESGSFECSEGDAPPALGALVFGPNGKLGFWICRQEKWYVHCGNQAYGPWLGFQRIVGSPNITNNFQTMTYVTEEDGRVRVGKNELLGPKYDGVGRPVLQDNLLAYKARVGDEEFLIVNGSKSQGYPVLWPEEREHATYLEDVPLMSSRGDRIAFLAARGTDRMVVDSGIEQPRYPNINGKPLFSSGSERLVYGAQNGPQNFVIIDSETIGPFDQVISAKKPSGLMLWDWCPEFSEDGKQLHFFSIENRKVLKCVINL